MRTVAWVVVGCIATALWTGLAARFSPGHMVPDAAVIVVVFLALRREPVVVALAALAMGYLMGTQALAPFGLYETTMVLTAVCVYVVSGQLAGGGALFFAMVCGGAASFAQVVTFLLLLLRGNAGFASWVTAALVPSGLITALTALASYPVLMWLEGRLSAEQREAGLSWH